MGEQLADLTLVYAIILPKPDNAAEIAWALNELDVVEYAEPARPPAPAPIDIFPPTPDFTGNQNYKSDAPVGIGVPTTLQVPGSDGGAYRYADVEYMWQLDHEDLELGTPELSDRYLLPITGPGRTCQPAEPPSLANQNLKDHGAAVLGIISGNMNAYGITGIAPGTNAAVVPVFCSGAKNGEYDVARAIDHAVGQGIRHILIEQQIAVCGLGDNSGRGPI